MTPSKADKNDVSFEIKFKDELLMKMKIATYPDRDVVS